MSRVLHVPGDESEVGTCACVTLAGGLVAVYPFRVRAAVRRPWAALVVISVGTVACSLITGISNLEEVAGSDGGAGDARKDTGTRGDADEDGRSGNDDAGDGSLTCVPGQLQCAGLQPQTCGMSGDWLNDRPPCSGATPVCAKGTCVLPPSCAPTGPGMTTCGVKENESCCTSLEVPGGTYDRAEVSMGEAGTVPSDPATVSDFRLDEYEVTVGRFRQFVAAWSGGSGYTPPAGSGKHTHLNGGKGLVNVATAGGYEPGWAMSDDSGIMPTNANLTCGQYATWTDTAVSNEQLPINCVNWYESYAFCIWDGGFLPSESEWGYATVGGNQQLEYPWGKKAPGIESVYAIYGCYYPFGAGSCVSTGNIAPVGTPTAGAGSWGQIDLVGSVSEWTLDWYQTYVVPCNDCAITTGGAGRVRRGGAFSDPTTYFTARVNAHPAVRIYSTGLRCARTP